MASLTPTPKQQIYGSDGNPLVGGKIYTYAAGTTTPLATYTDAGGLTANTNPIILNSLGQANIWLAPSSSYKFSVYTSADVLLYTVDNIATPIDYLSLITSLASPPPIGSTAPNTGAFTTLAATTGTITTVNATTVNATTVNATTLTFSDASVQTTAATGFGFKNRLINGNMALVQRATSATVTAGTTVPTASTGYPCVDRFFVYSTGANVTAAQVAGAGATQYRLQITGAASVTAVGVGQRIEQSNSYDMAGSTATLSVSLANTLLSTVTWTASYATTADTFGTIGTPTKTQIATGTFTVTSTVTNFSAQISIPAAATTGIEILFTVGAQTSGTFTVGNVQLEKGSTATAFDYRPIGTELQLCQRYFQRVVALTSIGNFNDSAQCNGSYAIPVTMRATPSMNTTGAIAVSDTQQNFTQTSAAWVFLAGNQRQVSYRITNLSPAITAFRTYTYGGDDSNFCTLSAEL